MSRTPSLYATVRGILNRAGLKRYDYKFLPGPDARMKETAGYDIHGGRETKQFGEKVFVLWHGTGRYGAMHARHYTRLWNALERSRLRHQLRVDWVGDRIRVTRKVS